MAVGDFRGSLTNDAVAVHAPVNVPPRDHLVQMCNSFRFRGERRPFAMAKANRADAYGQLPLDEEDELAAAVTLLNPRGGLRYGPISGTQLVGSTTAGLRYNCLSRAIAFLALGLYEAAN